MFSMSEPLRTRLCVSYFVRFTLLLITIASTNAAQQIAKIKPKIIIILILSYPNLFNLARLSFCPKLA